MNTPPNDHVLKSSLFVHDIKTPLAVIALGAKMLLTREEKYGPLAPKRVASIEQVIQKTEKTILLVNRSLGEVKLGRTALKSSDSRIHRLFFHPVARLCRRMAGNPQKAGGSDHLSSLLPNINDNLLEITSCLQSLNTQSIEARQLSERQTGVLRRMVRNAKIAANLAQTAIMSIGADNSSMTSVSRPLREIVIQALVEIFDLTDTDISDRLQVAESLPELQSVLAGKGFNLRVAEQTWVAAYRVDKGRLTQVLVNLLLNALKFRKKQVALEVRQNDGELSFSVKDDGAGIPSADQETIFDSSLHTEPPAEFPLTAHGLGLKGTRLILREMGGQLTLESTAGKGAEFRAILQISPEADQVLTS